MRNRYILFALAQRIILQSRYNFLMQNKLNTRYMPFLALAILALLFALWAGLLRLGWALPSIPNLALAHGPLMVSGFLGVLIPLERAVAIRQRWMFAVPVVASLGWVGLFFQPFLGALLMTLGSLGMLGILAFMVRREPHIHTVTMALWRAGLGDWQRIVDDRISHFPARFLVDDLPCADNWR